MDTERNMESRPLRQLTETIRTDFGSVRSTAMGWEQQLENFAQERPVAAVLSALGIGFFLARIFSRR